MVQSPVPADPPLSGLRIIEIAGIGPGPFACMMLADHGAEVIRIERPGGTRGGIDSPAATDILLRSRKRMQLDLKADAGRAVLHDLVAGADGLVEGFRPGVMERLALGPDDLLPLNPALVYGRMTGWGQTGPLAPRAGHDITYIALSGVLHMVGRKGQAPVPPANLLGDFGGGAMMLAFGMLAALLQARSTGRGQVVDAAMTDGSALLSAMMHTLMGQGNWTDARGVNVLDTGAHFYDVYETACGRHMAVGPIEPQFYDIFVDLMGGPDLAPQNDRETWEANRKTLAAIFATRTRDAWEKVFEGVDACVAPVLSLCEAPDHPHNAARATFVTAQGVRQPAPAPRYSASPTVAPRMPGGGTDTDELLRRLGYEVDRIAELRAAGSVA